MREEEDIPVGGSGKVRRTAEPPGMSIVGLALGILSVILCWLPVLGLLGGAAGIILSYMGNNKYRTGFGTWGFIISILGTVLSIIFLIAGLFGVFYLMK